MTWKSQANETRRHAITSPRRLVDNSNLLVFYGDISEGHCFCSHSSFEVFERICNAELFTSAFFEGIAFRIHWSKLAWAYRRRIVALESISSYPCITAAGV